MKEGHSFDTQRYIWYYTKDFQQKTRLGKNINLVTMLFEELDNLFGEQSIYMNKLIR